MFVKFDSDMERIPCLEKASPKMVRYHKKQKSYLHIKKSSEEKEQFVSRKGGHEQNRRFKTETLYRNNEENTEHSVDVQLPLIGKRTTKATEKHTSETKPRFTINFRQDELPRRVHEKIMKEIVNIDRKLREDMFLQEIRIHQRDAYNRLSREEKVARITEGTFPRGYPIVSHPTPLLEHSKHSYFATVPRSEEMLASHFEYSDEIPFGLGVDVKTFHRQRQRVQKKMNEFGRYSLQQG